MSTNNKLESIAARRRNHLLISVGLDLLGMFTYAIPLLGEIGDVLYAPIYSLSIFLIYRRRKLPALAAGVTGFVEEILPMTDFFPTATVMWVYTYVVRKEKKKEK